ncbi:VCBS repeat-containing protein [Patescibacteria group bacterium]|nr:VCBS repeat-containing protein [Patescibacteria group bacterium]
MSKKSKKCWRLLSWISVFTLIMLMSNGWAVIPIARAGTLVVSGTVLDELGAAEENVQVSLHTGDGLKSYNDMTDAGGNFSFNTDDAQLQANPLTDGDQLVLEVSPPSGYNRPTNSPVNFTWDGSTFSGNPVSFQLVIAPKIVTGTATMKDTGALKQGVEISAYPVGKQGISRVSAVTDQNGQYSLNLQSGVPSWSVKAEVNLSDYNTDWLPTGPAVDVSFASDDSAETASANFTVENTTASVSGTFLDADGDLLTSGQFRADCDLSRSDGVGTIRKVDANSQLVNIGLPAGIYGIWCYHNALSGSAFPANQTKFVLREGENKNLGTIQAQHNSATISGGVIDTLGNPVANIQVTASSAETPQFLATDTDPNGGYSFTVGEGTWTIGVNQGAGNQYRLTNSRSVNIANNGDTSSDNNLVVERMDQQVMGEIKDESNNTIDDFSGTVYVTATTGEVFGTAVDNGQYEIPLPTALSGQSVEVGVASDVGSSYSLPQAATATVSPNTGLDLGLSPESSTITGELKDSDGDTLQPGENDVVVIAVDASDNIEKGTMGTDGRYSLSVPAGNWNVTYQVQDEDSNIISPAVQDNRVIVSNGQTASLDLGAKEEEATISGSILDPDGEDVALAPVIATNLPILEGVGEFEPEDVVQVSTYADANGDYSLAVPAGEYKIITGVTPDLADNVIEPEAQIINITAGVTQTANLSFTDSDAVISGVVLDASGNPVSSGSVGAYTENGGFVKDDIDANGQYSLPVDAGDEWKLTAAAVSGNNLLKIESTVTTEAGANQRNLTLEDANISVPGSVTREFDADQLASVTLPSGSTVQLSPFAIDTSGTVEVSLEPSVELNPSMAGDPVSVSYNVKARNGSGVEVSNLGSPAKISLPYDEALLEQQDITENNLVPQYFADNEEYWNSGGMATLVDSEQNRVVAYSEHLTKFNITGVPTPASDSRQPTPTPSSGEMVNGLVVTSPQSAGGPQYITYKADGTKLKSFFAYSDKLRGEFKSVMANIDGEGAEEIITYPGEGMGPHVRAFTQQGEAIASFMAYDEGFRGGLNVVAADLNNDGKDEIIVAPEGQGGSNVRVYSYSGGKFELLTWQMAYDEKFHGGVSLAAGDLTGDGQSELITAPLTHGSANIRVYQYTEGELELVDWVLAYDEGYHGGVNMASGDLDGDGSAELVVAPRSGGGPNVRVYSLANGQINPLGWFMAYDEKFRGGVSLAVGDFDYDGQAEIITAPEGKGGANIRIYKYENGSFSNLLDWFMAYNSSFRQGVHIAARDLNEDGKVELVITPKTGGGPNLRVYNLQESRLELLNWFWAYDSSFRGGVNVTLGNRD